MFFVLLLVTLVLALLVSHLVARLFDRPIGSILRRIVAEDLSSVWHRYIMFAVYVVGVSGGVRIHELERYVIAREEVRGDEPLVLTAERWTLEIYRTIIETLQAVAWMLLVVFVVALLAFVLVKGFEWRQGRSPPEAP